MSLQRPRVPSYVPNPRSVQAQGLQLWHSVGGGGAVRDNARGRTVTIGGAPVVSRATPWGDSIDFDGSNDYVEFASGEIVNTARPFCISALVYLDAFTAYYPMICTVMSNSSQQFQFGFSNQAAFLGLIIGSDTTWVNGRTNTPSADLLTKWLRVSVTYNGGGAGTLSNFTAWINGVRTSFTSAGTFLAITKANRLGWPSGAGGVPTGQIWNGVIADCRVNVGVPPEAVALSYARDPFELYRREKPAIYSLPSIAPSGSVGAVFLPKRWRQQPTSPVGVDWNNALTRNLVYLDNPVFGLRPVHSLVGGTIQTVGTVVSPKAGPFGIATWTPAANRASVALDSTLMSAVFSGQKATCATHFNGRVASGGTANGFHNLGATALQSHYIYSANAELGAFRSIRRSIAVSATVLARPHVLTISADAAAVAYNVYQENTLVDSSTFSWQLSGTPRLYGWSSNGTQTYDGMDRSCLGTALWARALNAAEVRALNENWWQLFRSLRPRIYSIPSLGAGLNSAGIYCIGV